MAKLNLIAGMDIGSGKITAVSAYMDQETGKLKVVAGVVVPCEGLREGIVTNIKQVSSAVANVIRQLEEKSGGQVLRGLYIALRGEHLQSMKSQGSYNISRADKEVTSEDIKRVIENASGVSIKSDNEIVNVIPQGFTIDKQQRGIPNPEGMVALTSLDVDVYIVTGHSSALMNLQKPIENIGLRIDDTYYGLMCLCENVLRKEEKQLGAILIDLGGQTISVGICADGILQYSKEFNFGCDLVTSDIAAAFNTSTANAQKIKEESGLCFPRYNEDAQEEEVRVPSLDGKTITPFKKTILLDIIQPRMQEFFEAVRDCIIESDLSDLITRGVITGGGSAMPGIENLASQVLGVKEIHRGLISRDFVDAEEELFDSKYTTAISLLLYVTKREIFDQKKESEIVSKSPIMKVCKNFFRKIINSEIFGG